jgi:hypothetical protein
MPPSKIEQVQRLIRARDVREEELRASDEIARKATLRSHTLRAAIADLTKTIEELIGPGEVPPEVLANAAPEVQRLARDDPPRGTEGTLLYRVLAYVQSVPGSVDAREVSKALGTNIDGVRTALSKLTLRGQIDRLGGGRGRYCSVQHGDSSCGEPSDTREEESGD